jgi:hypothetical protein
MVGTILIQKKGQCFAWWKHEANRSGILNCGSLVDKSLNEMDGRLLA